MILYKIRGGCDRPNPGIGDPYWFEWCVGLKYIIEMLNPDSRISCVIFQHETFHTIDDVVVDPGMQGLGIIDCDEVAEILEILKENRDEAESAEPDGLLHETDPDEWMEAYDSLCNLYEEAKQQEKGILFTF